MIIEASKRELKMDFRKICNEQLVEKSTINPSSHNVFKFIRFGDVLEDGISADDRTYDEICEYPKLLKRIEIYLEDYNASSKTQMHVSLFKSYYHHRLMLFVTSSMFSPSPH